MPAAAQAADTNTMLLNNLKEAGQKIIQLAEATPEPFYTWKPVESVRSISEAFMHVASSNYMFASRLTGAQPPADAQGLEQNVIAKAEVLAKLKDSFNTIYAALEKADLSAETDLFGGRKGRKRTSRCSRSRTPMNTWDS